jgi:hypothetical protein
MEEMNVTSGERNELMALQRSPYGGGGAGSSCSVALAAG